MLTAVALSDDVTSVGDNAFRNTGLTAFKIPSSCTSISTSAFKGCYDLESFDVNGTSFTFSAETGILADKDGNTIFNTNLPEGSATYINPSQVFPAGTVDATVPKGSYFYTTRTSDPFGYCYSTVSTLASQNKDFVVDEQGILYTADMTQLIKAPVNISGTVKVPDTVTYIWAGAFRGCDQITALDLRGTNVNDIASHALLGVSGVTSFALPATMWAESNADSFIADPTSARSNEVFSFKDVTGGEANQPTLEAPSNVTGTANVDVREIDLSDYQQTFLPHYAFAYCLALEDITLPKTIRSIGKGTFYADDNLKDVYVFTQNLRVEGAGETGDASLGWSEQTPGSFFTYTRGELPTGSHGYTPMTGINFYGMNYGSNYLKTYADSADCTFVPFVFLGGYDDVEAMADKIDGGASTLAVAEKSNVIEVSGVPEAFTGAFDVSVKATWAESTGPAVPERALSGDSGCTITVEKAGGAAQALSAQAVEANEDGSITVSEPGTYTLTIQGDGKSVFGTYTQEFTVEVDKSALDSALADAAAVTQGAKTDEAWKALQAAIAAAQAVADDTAATADEVASAASTLNAAVATFKASADKAAEPEKPADEPIVPATADTRLAGENALGTMQKIVQKGFAKSDAVVVASLDGYWDALAASSLAGQVGCPVLMTDPSSLSAETASEIERLGATKAYIAGGEAAVSAAVEAQLAAKGLQVERLWGADAQVTAVRIAEALGSGHGGTCVIATSNGYWDALSASPYAYQAVAPVFLTDASGELRADTLEAIKAGGYSGAVIAGGTAVVAESAEQALKDAGLASVERCGGANAYETAILLAKWEMAQGMGVSHIGVATSANGYWDALSGAALCGVTNSVIILADGGDTTAVDQLIAPNRAQIAEVNVFGGTAAVDPSVDDAIAQALAATTAMSAQSALVPAAL